jgi:hypothetical protein
MTIQHQSWGRFMNFNGVFLVKWGNQGSLKVFGSLTGHGKPFPAVQGWIEEMPKSADRLKVWPQQRKPRKPSPPKSASLPNLVQTWIFDACFYMFLTALAFVSHFKPEKKKPTWIWNLPSFQGLCSPIHGHTWPKRFKESNNYFICYVIISGTWKTSFKEVKITPFKKTQKKHHEIL